MSISQVSSVPSISSRATKNNPTIQVTEWAGKNVVNSAPGSSVQVEKASANAIQAVQASSRSAMSVYTKRGNVISNSVNMSKSWWGNWLGFSTAA